MKMKEFKITQAIFEIITKVSEKNNSLRNIVRDSKISSGLLYKESINLKEHGFLEDTLMYGGLKHIKITEKGKRLKEALLKLKEVMK